MTEIYPKELVLVPDDSNGCTAPFLDLQLLITEGVISTSIYDKRDAFDFPIVNFPNLSGNIPNKSAYGTFICELVRHAVAAPLYLTSLLELCYLLRNLKIQDLPQRDCNKLIVSSVHLI